MATNNPNIIPLVNVASGHLFANTDCPHQLGINECNLSMGHDGMHFCHRILTDTVGIEVFWADEWLALSKEAELQVGGSEAEVGLA